MYARLGFLGRAIGVSSLRGGSWVLIRSILRTFDVYLAFKGPVKKCYAIAPALDKQMQVQQSECTLI